MIEIRNPVAMVRHMEYSDIERQLATQARAVAKARDVLYHGTRYSRSILNGGALLRASTGEPKVCLTRNAEVAAYFALMKRDDDEGRGSILIFDRQSLQRQYQITVNPKPHWHTKTMFHDEAEEEIWVDVYVGKHLIGFVSEPGTGRLQKPQKLISTR